MMNDSHDFAHAGLSTMTGQMEFASNYYDWLYSVLAPDMGRSVLELGPGYGNLARRILKDGRRYAGVDIDPGVVDGLRRSFKDEPNARFLCMDLLDRPSVDALKAFAPDTVVATHVLEHVEDPRPLLANLYRAAAGGRVLVLVPAFPCLFGRWDNEAGHYRRYSRGGLKALLADAGTLDLRLRFFDAVGLPGLFLLSKVLRLPLNAPESNRSIAAFDRLVVPWAKHLDLLFSGVAGVNLVASGRIPA